MIVNTHYPYIDYRHSDSYLTISSTHSFSLVYNYASYAPLIYYSTDATNWTMVKTGDVIDSSDNGYLFLRGSNNTYLTGGQYTITPLFSCSASNMIIDGNIETLLDYETVQRGSHPTAANYCFCALFRGWSGLVKGPELPLTTIPAWGCSDMFLNCTSLRTAPELPATTLGSRSYNGMFAGCSSLTTAPELPAMVLEDSCYIGMFARCTSLTIAPSLPATTLRYGCYEQMFEDCTSLTTIPNLPATNVASQAYMSMFEGCTGVKISQTQTSTYKNAYYIGSGTSDSFSLMFWQTGGTFTGTPTGNTTYYTSNTVI